MALAMTGQEYVFRRMYEDLGLTREELNGFFGGPAYMPWQRMGNIQGSWIIPNDTQYKNDWIDSQWELQGQIMKRIREFNMTAILPSFHGFVPRELVSKYPNTTFGRSSQWKGLSDPYSRVRFIPSMDPLFASLTQRFLQLQSTMYEEQGLGYQGDRHFYLLDLYNEIQPMSLEPDHLRTTTYEVMKSLKDADPKAVWTMQSWFLLDRNIWKTNETKAFFNGILDMNHGQDAFVIDLHSEVVPLWKETHGFFGIDWGWSMLNNFGGGHGLYGTLPIVLTEPFKGYQQASRTMQGMGITMEAINNNEYMYQIVLDIPWESAEATIPSVAVDAIHTIIHPKRQRLNQPPLDGQAHFRAYLKRRYGPKQTSEAMIEAWTTLSRTVWDCRTGQMKQSKSKLEAIPSLDISSHKFWYNQTKVVESWNTLVRSTETERSKERRGHGIIQNAIDYALRTASGHPIRDLWGSDNQILSERRKETTLRSNHTRSILGTIFAWMNGSGKSFPQSIFSSPKRLSTQQLPKEADLPLNVSSFRYDLVDVTREVMVAIVIPGIHQELIDAYSAKDLDQTRFLGTLLLNAINDTDKILATHTSFMLGPWIRDARTSARIATSSHSTTTTGLSKSLPSQEQGAGSSYMDGYADYLEQSARTLITWWGNEGQASLADYASKHWAGLVQDFYYPRWKIFVDHLVNAVNHSKELDSMALKKELLRIESKWLKLKTCLGAGCHHCSEKGAESGNRRQDYKLNPTEDTTEVAQDLWDRWAHAATRLVQKAEGAKLTHA
ncbi:hypothetical protein BGX31_000109 [Mortierella sp. GBA43]|nr:hypothetical protein BGX31_000109 [Mortierella sp. GBA43]